MSIQILSRTGIDIEVNVSVGFCLGLASAMSFPVGIDSVTYLSSLFAIPTDETVFS